MGNKLFYLLIFSFVACTDNTEFQSEYSNKELVLHSSNSQEASTTSGNLIASAIKTIHELDIVLYPSSFLSENAFALYRPNDRSYRPMISSLYTEDIAKDSFLIGRMSGKDIKHLISDRARRLNSLPFQAAGLSYHVQLKSGQHQYSYFNLDRGPLQDDVFYKIAISEYEYDYRKSFPGYYYAHGLNYSFLSVGLKVSAQKALDSFLDLYSHLDFLDIPRATLTRAPIENLGFMKIYDIQGTKHISSYHNKKVIIRGVVTAIGERDNSFKGFDLYLQEQIGDNNPLTSDGIHVFLENNLQNLKVGNLVELEGIVYEENTSTGLSRTSLQKISRLLKLEEKVPLPEAILLGVNGREIPDAPISSWRGDLNLKPNLNLNDPVDFWESLEGMRVKIQNPRVMGFRGGYQSITDRFAKNYLNLYVLPDGDIEREMMTRVNGLMSDPVNSNFNSMVIQILKNHISHGFNHQHIYSVGDLLEGEIEGVLAYEPNIFGEGEWSILIPEEQPTLAPDFIRQRNITPLKDRPKTKFQNLSHQITIANYNVENLTASDGDVRFESLGQTISETLNCPTIINLVEIQDHNGEAFEDGSFGEMTLEKVIKYINCKDSNYASVNIDPLNHGEGGVPGGNIRVAMLYDQNKVSFTPRPAPGPTSETIVQRDGSLNYNPGRVFPNDQAFRGSRKSIVAEFEFKGERFFVIGNHFNSKLSDRSPWGNIQPQDFRSETQRRGMAYAINRFVQILESQNSNALIAVTGDFNAYINETSLKVLMGNQLINTMDFIPKNQRYTTNHNGSSQALDYLFVNKAFLKKDPELEILHINSDYQGRYSDHDPLLVQFSF